MEEECFMKYFKIRKLRGRNETDIYKNYVKDLPDEQIKSFFDKNFPKMCVKDDALAAKLRQHGNTANKREAFLDALTLLNKSLCYANYNGEAYAFALANRSHSFLELGDFENCIHDIDLCLKAKYPDIVRPTLCIRKAECLKQLGRITEMKTTLLDTLQLIDESMELPHEIAENYKKSVTVMLKGASSLLPNNNDVTLPSLVRIPDMTENEKFLNASNKLELRCTKRLGKHVVAAQNITKGETLFVEKAYAFSPLYNQDGFSNMCPNYCHYCLIELDNCVPCKKCTSFVYCNEKCRDASWNEFHRWECLAVQANLFKYIRKSHISLRIIIKAAHKGFNRAPPQPESDMAVFGNKTNNYPYVYQSCTSINRLPQNHQMQLAAVSALLVNYLKLKTDFFNWLANQPGCGNKSDVTLMNEVGALILKHCAELPNKFLTVKSYDSATLVDEECFPIYTEIATAVCPSVTTLRHSCVSNTSFYFVGDTVVVKALTDINANEEIFMAYLEINYITMNTQERQESLEKNCCMKCKCIACIDPTLDLVSFDSMKCIKCEGRAPIVYANRNAVKIDCSCRHCNLRFVLPQEIMQQIQNYTEIWNKFEQTHEIGYIKDCLDICKNVYSPTHKLFNMIFWQLLKLHVEAGNLFEAVRVGMSLREFAYRRVIYNTAFECGLQIYLVCKIILEQFNHTKATTMDMQELGEMIADVSSFLDETKLIFDLHYPPSINHIQKLQNLLEIYISIYSKRMDESPDGTASSTTK